jgi:uncharacterized membrane protein YoaK (UPF0700 family)
MAPDPSSATEITTVIVETELDSRPRVPVHRRFHAHVKTPPPTPFRREILLTLTTIQTGILDACIYVSLGRVFVANMTGNIVLLGLAVANLEIDVDVLPICVSLVAFFVGGFFTGILERWTAQEEGQHSRIFFASMTVVDAILDFVSAILIFKKVVPVEPGGNTRLVVFAFLAFGQGALLVLTKRAGLPEFSNAVVTNTYIDLSTDEHLFHICGDVRVRNRRAVSLLSLLIGALVGAYIYKYCGLGLALIISGVISVATAIGWVI